MSLLGPAAYAEVVKVVVRDRVGVGTNRFYVARTVPFPDGCFLPRAGTLGVEAFTVVDCGTDLFKRLTEARDILTGART